MIHNTGKKTTSHFQQASESKVWIGLKPTNSVALDNNTVRLYSHQMKIHWRNRNIYFDGKQEKESR